MAPFPSGDTDVFTIRDVARAAGATVGEARALLEASDLPNVDGRLISLATAAELVVALRQPHHPALAHRRLFAPAPRLTGGSGPFAASGALHVGVLTMMVLFAGLGLRSESRESRLSEPARLVFLALPGPGGGGGGGGLQQPKPPPKAALAGKSALRSPVAVIERRDPPRKPVARRVEMAAPPVPVPVPDPEPAPAPLPQPAPPIAAPVVSAPADPVDRAGVVDDSQATAASNGPGASGGTGGGRGTGSGEGNGAGIGPGAIAGIGGGPYRPGSGITAPTLVREVKPIYTEEARRRGVEGDVVLEVVVSADGRVGEVRVVHSLGSGLDQRAIEAVRQWSFTPARRLGTPVDVLVEVAVEFRLR
jgi:TonB family protein